MTQEEKNKISERFKTHGLRHHPLYTVWADIKKRCFNSKSRAYKWYGAKGIIMCEEWRDDFKKFYEWAINKGWAPGMRIDKDIIPKSIGIPAMIYSPDMCSVVTNKDNMNAMSTNVNIEYLGEVKTIRQWADLYNRDYKLVWRRVKNGWGIHNALTLPVQNLKRKITK